MKKHIFTLLALLACSIYSVRAYEYFTIYFSDGTKSEAFYATDVDSICYSKLSLDSIAYDDWQVQEIYTCDSVYRYPLAQIDSLSFKDVDVNKVADVIVNAMEQSDQILFGIINPNATEILIPQLSEINGVEDIQLYNRQLTLKICDWGNIKYYYPPEESYMNPIGESESVIKRMPSIHKTIQNQQSSLKACIANQQAKDQRRAFFFDIANNVGNAFSAIGIQTDSIPMPEPIFFSNDILDYDIAFIKTHGFYDKKDRLHWLVTGQEVLVRNKNGADYNSEKLKQIIQMEKFSPRQVCMVGLDEIRNRDTVKVFYIAVSQEFIKKGTKKGERNTIIFNTACQSVMGPSWVSEVENNPDYSLAKAYINRGAGCYLGFDDSNSVGAYAGEIYLFGMMNGMSAKNSYSEEIIVYPEWFHQDNYDYYDEDGNLKVDHEKKEGKLYMSEDHPTLRCYPSNASQRIVYPITLDAEITTAENNFSVKLKGKMQHIIEWESIDKDFHFSRSLKSFGFDIADNPDMIGAAPYDNPLRNYDKTIFSSFFEQSIHNKLQPNTTYYYRAYMNDGYSDCYGEIKSFTTKGDEEAYWVYNDVDSITTYYYDDKIESRNGVELKYRQKPSAKIIFDSSFANFFPHNFSFRGMGELREIENICYLNTDSLTSMNTMFGYCTLLKQLDLSNFHTENVTDMSYMFDGCESLKSLDLKSFNTSKVTCMQRMFNYCNSLSSLNLSSFDTSNVTDMSWMFYYCRALDSLNLRSFNTSNVTDMHRMFCECYSLENLDISTFNTKKVVDMAGMFSMCRSLRTLDVSRFDTSSLIDMSGSRMDEGDAAGNYDGMFAGCKSLKAMDLSNFDTSKVTDMHQLFQGCTNLRELNLRNFVLINNWNRDCSIFFDCDSLYSIDLSEGKIVGCGEGLFRGLGNLRELILYNVDTSNVDDMSGMFDGCRSLEELNLSSFDTSKVMDMWGMFNNCTLLRDLDISNFIISDNVISKNENGYCFNGLFGTSHLASSLENIILNNACIKGEGGASLFAGLTALKNLELNNVDTSESTNMDRMFAWCSSLQDVNLNSFNTNDVSNMREMFSGCTSLKNLNLGTFNTSKVNDMSMMFASCDSLRSLDLSNFNTFNVANMREMFSSKSLENLNIKNFVFNNANWPFGSHGGCPSLVSIDLSNGKAIGEGAEGLFFSLSSLKKVNLDNFDTSEAVNLSCMFCGCSSLTILDLSSFNVSKVNDVTGIFSGCHSLTKIYAGNWYNDINNDYPNHGGFSGDTLIFTDCKNLVGGQGTKVGENYFKGDDGETGIYHCYGSVWDAHIDGGKENPGLFTAK